MDKKAKNILFQTYWRNGCWVDQKNRRVDSADFLYAKNNGVMFDPLTISHDDCISHIVALSNKIPSDAVARTFLSSLSTRRLEWRSAVASWVCAKQIQPHIYTPVQSGHFYENGIIVRTSYTCGICMNLSCHSGGYESYKDKDLNILNFERIKWGGVRLGDLIYT
ncbi:MAG: hypothetical protein FWE85_03575, partial [Clostridiales bacterium]|nr:hypothetical protein [Clostridiales bacterium]